MASQKYFGFVLDGSIKWVSCPVSDTRRSFEEAFFTSLWIYFSFLLIIFTIMFIIMLFIINSCGTAPRHSERRTLFFELPSLLSAIILLSCFSLPLRYADFLQNFCSAEICTTSLHQQGRDLFVHSLFNIFSRETTFLTSAFGGLRESHTLSLHLRARFFSKKRRKKNIVDSAWRAEGL